jgi:hypothetical protein
MHTVEVLDRALRVAESLSYGVRHEWLGGSGGGACEFAGRKWIFVDLALTVTEQLDQVLEALRSEPAIHTVPMPAEIRRLLDRKLAA